MSEQEIKRFADFADTKSHPIMDGEKVALQKILNKEIKVTAYKIKDTKFDDAKNNKCLMVQFEDSTNERKVFFTGSAVLIDQIERYKDHIPFLATIVKTGKFFSFS